MIITPKLLMKRLMLKGNLVLDKFINRLNKELENDINIYTKHTVKFINQKKKRKKNK